MGIQDGAILRRKGQSLFGHLQGFFGTASICKQNGKVVQGPLVVRILGKDLAIQFDGFLISMRILGQRRKIEFVWDALRPQLGDSLGCFNGVAPFPLLAVSDTQCLENGRIFG